MNEPTSGDESATLGVKATFYFPDKPDHTIVKDCEEIRPVVSTDKLLLYFFFYTTVLVPVVVVV